MQETLAKLSDNPFCYEPSADDIAGGERVGRYQEAHQCEGAAEAEETAGPAKVLAFVNIVMRITAGVRGVKCATDRIPIAARERERAGLYPEAHQCGHASDGEKEVDPAKPLAFVNTIRGITAGWRAAKVRRQSHPRSGARLSPHGASPHRALAAA